MLDTLKWMNIRQKLQFNTCILIFKMKIGYAPEYLTQELSYVNEVQPYNLRNGDDFRINRVATNKMKRCLLYKGLQLFNQLPNYVKNETNINAFKRNCVIHVKNGVYQSI